MMGGGCQPGESLRHRSIVPLPPSLFHFPITTFAAHACFLSICDLTKLYLAAVGLQFIFILPDTNQKPFNPLLPGICTLNSSRRIGSAYSPKGELRPTPPTPLQTRPKPQAPNTTSMATGGTAPPLAMANHSHSLLDQDSTVSSPLSSPQAEGQDVEPDDIDMKSNPSDDEGLDKPTLSRAESPANVTHDESDLSDLETNDSEAETERLYDTPRKNNAQISTAATDANSEQKAHDKNTRTFPKSPSKLQEQIQADVEAESGDDENDEPPQSKRIHGDDDKTAKKRKRSLLQDQADVSEPARKRSGSILEANDETSSLSKPTESTDEKSAEHSGDEENNEAPTTRGADDAVKIESVRSRSKRNSTRKRKGLEEDLAPEVAEEPEEHLVEEEQPAEDEPVATAEIDEEARHEEESERNHHCCCGLTGTDHLATVERKRHAFGQLSSIEKNFAILRDRLYEERLKELNEEEALLTSDNPTHPEYLAMMECIDSRRDDRLRISEIEYRFDMDALNRWAVARRAQILSQYYQSVRESREKTMDELGKQWYEIQHERRKNANPIPDYGFRFPKDKAQQKKQAIAHNKETSILAGIAQHHGFPAAPEMKPASQAEVEDDFEAMHVSLRMNTPQAGVHRLTGLAASKAKHNGPRAARTTCA